MIVCSINGVLGPAVVSVLDRGALYGDGVFEVLRTYGNAPHALEAHLTRLTRGAAALGITAPSPATWRDELRAVVRERTFRTGEQDHAIRMVVTRGEGAGLDHDGPASWRIIASALRLPSAQMYRAGIAVVTQEVRRERASLKGLGYVESVLATRHARQMGAHEAILVRDGLALEGASSNVFAVIEGALHTYQGQSALMGVTRRLVLEAAGRMGHKIVLSAPRLEEASEVFITSSIREMLPVTKVNDRPLGSPGPLFSRLHEVYRAAIGQETGWTLTTD